MTTPMAFDRAEWAARRAATPLELTAADLDGLRGHDDPVDLDEVVDVYLPLSRLLDLRVAASRELLAVTDAFLGRPARRVPFVIAIAGSVAVGKSTTARLLQALLARWPGHPKVALVPTDGFLHPNDVLAARGILERKGFPESYDTRALLEFLVALKQGDAEVVVPVYDHSRYDVDPDARQVLVEPDIVLVEGLNVLQVAPEHPVLVSDHFDFTIYVDADEPDIERWYVDRFVALQEAAFDDEASFFHRFAALDRESVVGLARAVWAGVNGPNLAANILPTRGRADLVLEKGPDHRVRRVVLRPR